MTHYATTAASVDDTLTSRATQSQREQFAAVLRYWADVVERRELAPMERIGFTHVEYKPTEEQ